MRSLLIILATIILIPTFSYSKNQKSLSSPDGNITVTVINDKETKLSVNYKNRKIIDGLSISMTIDGKKYPTPGSRVRYSEIKSLKSRVHSPVPLKNRYIEDSYKELTVKYRKNFCLQVRVYDNGFAYRFKRSRRGKIKVEGEELLLSFDDSHTVFFPEEKSLISHYERLYIKNRPSAVKPDTFCSLPVLVKRSDNISILLTEADQHDYPGMFLKKDGESSFRSLFPKVPLEIKAKDKGPDRNEEIIKTADYIALTDGHRNFPWRVFMISDQDKKILNNELVYLLSTAPDNRKADWIRPGKVAWDWWNANNLHGVDFKAGINTETYKYYIDFASENRLEYVILDEGWSASTTNIEEYKKEINVEELIKYGNRKGVKVILWVLWKPLDKRMQQALDLYRKWGAAGIKVDFMQRADQYMVNFYERVAAECFSRQLLVDFHGSFKPAGLRRTWPNVMSYEGVKGLENNKWSKAITPEHNLTLPFIRMAAGPMDYTPGAMRNFQPRNFKQVFDRPGSMGTRCHQVAMYIIYESALQMLSDTPSNYRKEKETVQFISQIPAVWDETITIDGSIGEYVVMARRKGDIWYIGAMTSENPRNFKIDLSFLPLGKWDIQIMKDGINADRMAEDYKFCREQADKLKTITAELAPGGGWAAILTPLTPN